MYTICQANFLTIHAFITTFAADKDSFFNFSPCLRLMRQKISTFYPRTTARPIAYYAANMHTTGGAHACRHPIIDCLLHIRRVCRQEQIGLECLQIWRNVCAA